MVSTETHEPVVERERSSIPAVVDYLIAALAALAGVALLVGGSALALLVDRPLIAEAIREEAVGSGTLSEAELITASLAIVDWSGVGLAVAGLLLTVGAVAYVVHRRRVRSARAAGEAGSDYLGNAVVGAAAGALLSFLPVPTAIGGALAGYLERGESERTAGVGALSGLVSVAPLLVALVFVAVGVVAAGLEIGQAGLAVVGGAGVLFALTVVAAVGAGLGALGGYLGGLLAER